MTSPSTTQARFHSRTAATTESNVVAMRSRSSVAVAEEFAQDLSRTVRTIDCADCSMRRTSTCRDCVVTHLLDRTSTRVDLSGTEFDTLQLLQHVGLAPASQFAVRPVALAGRCR